MFEQTAALGSVTGSSVAFTINVPKKHAGEDAEPLLRETDAGLWLGVFDGMGGAGAGMYETSEGRKTGAQIAANKARSAIDQELVHAPSDFVLDFTKRTPLAEWVKNTVRGSLLEEMNRIEPEPSRVRSKMIRSLPTTLALVQIRKAETSVGRELTALWSGDSRIYLLSVGGGMVQLTRDHVTGDSDAQANLSNDSPLSNCASADQHFYVEELSLRAETPFVIIAATDGCFGYVESPALFEWMFLDGLRRSDDLLDWRKSITDSIMEITADDASLALVGVGFEDYAHLKQAFDERTRALEPLVNSLWASRAKLVAAQKELEQREVERQYTFDAVWSNYRRTYEHQWITHRTS